MSQLTVINFDSLCCAPYAALADIPDVEFQSTTPTIAAQLLRDGEANLSLISLSEFFNHGGYTALGYGLIVSPLNNAAYSNFLDETLLSTLACNWLATTKRPCPLAIWAFSGEQVPSSIILPYLELGLAAQVTYLRDWAKCKQMHPEGIERQVSQSVSYRFDSLNLELLFEFAHFGITAGKFPNNAVTLLEKSMSSARSMELCSNNQRISFHETLQRALGASIGDLSLAATQHSDTQSSNSLIETLNESASELEFVGDFNYYEQLLSSQSNDGPLLTLSANDIYTLAHYSTAPTQHVLERLRDAGLATLNAIGGECLVATMRDKISHSTLSAQQWLAIHQQAHLLGISSTATIDANTLLNWQQYLEHLLSLRQLQDETQGFTSISISPSSNNPPEIETLLRLFFVTKLFMDNFTVVTVTGETVTPAMHNLFTSFGRRSTRDGYLSQARLTNVGTLQEKGDRP